MSARPTAWHVIRNLDGSFRGYEWALDENDEWQPSKVYAQENRDADGRPLPAKEQHKLRSPLKDTP